ncbi:helix-turn-helix domain-containing protein [Flaviaesturariibacter terrae]
MDAQAVAPGRMLLAPLPAEEDLVRTLKKAGLGNVPNDGVLRAARLLLWVAGRPEPITYADISRSLHLSESGACKLVSSLRRRSLLERSGWQRLRLTEVARKLLYKDPTV